MNFQSKISNAFQKNCSVKKRRRRRLVNLCLAGRGEVRIQTVSAGFGSQPDQACTSWWHNSSHLLCTNLQVETIGLEKAKIYITLKPLLGYTHTYIYIYMCMHLNKYVNICKYLHLIKHYICTHTLRRYSYISLSNYPTSYLSIDLSISICRSLGFVNTHANVNM